MQINDGTIAHHAIMSWFPYLDATEFKVVSYIIEHSLGRGRSWLRATTDQIVKGAGTRQSIGLTGRTFERVKKTLRERGLLSTSVLEMRFTDFALNLDWSPAPGVPSIADALEAHRKSVERAEPICQIGNPVGINKISNNIPPSGTGSLRSPERVLSSQEKTSSPEKENPPPVAPPPSRISTELREEMKARAAETERRCLDARQQRAAKAKEQDSIGAYHRTYVNAWAETYPGVPCPTWTERDMHIVRSVLKSRLRENIQARHDFLNFIVCHWAQIIATQFGWMRHSSPPDMPKVSFFTSGKMIGRFLDAYADRRRFDQIEALPAEEQELERLVAHGKTREQALIAVGERRALSKAKAQESEVKRFNGDMVRRAEASRARLMEERKQLLRERAQQVVADETGKAGERFTELSAFVLPLIDLPPIDFSRWS
ncbi:hypothetical protein [Agrobacterium sp.]|uniref:hypothetical protein n=1 Tax=Agrobacterium sp. TaxID=361 RepID=UPI0028A0468D|nr:hypothetical protein [Agrobacterium sp.]